MNTLTHKHTWEYTITSLNNIVYRFESYLWAIRYYPLNNTVLEFVEKC